MSKRISQLIGRAIHERHLSLREAARHFGVTHQAIARWASGDTAPDDSTLFAMLASSTPWVSELAARCIAIRYPVIVEVLALRAKAAAKQEIAQ